MMALSSFWLLAAAAACLAVVGAQQEEECGMYVAVSSTSTSDELKWGLYAGVDIEKGAPVGPPDVAIQTFDLMGNNREEDDEDDTMALQIVEFFEQFIWVPDSSAGKWELPKGRTVTAIPGAGVLGGFNVKLTNADWDHSSAFFRPAMGEQPGVAHPGRGAYSGFFNVGLKSKDSILAGSEIFLDYGENWEAAEEEDDEEEELNKKDYERVDLMVDQMIEFLDKYKDDLTEASRAEVYDFLVKDVMGAAAGSKKGRKITALLPTDPADLQKVKDAGGSLMYSVPASKRPLDWLKTNGRCMDHLEVKASTIQNAGRGAFSKRAISEGNLIVPLPLVHIPRKEILDIYDVASKGKQRYRVDDESKGTQLLLNYCLGHPESTMVFFPSGSSALLINHSKEKANAKLVWSQHPEHQVDWYDTDPDRLVEEGYQYIGLMMEVVATKDIAPGDEIFLDYGDEWDAAWDLHVEEFDEKVADGSVPNPWPTMALDLNEEHREKPFRTVEEQEKEPYPEDVRQMCFLVLDGNTEETVRQWEAPETASPYTTDNLFDCTVTKRSEGENKTYVYSVEYVSNEEETMIIENVPHQAVTFIDAAGKSDHFFQGAFRHYIGIPDDIFPQGPWRNLA